MKVVEDKKLEEKADKMEINGELVDLSGKYAIMVSNSSGRVYNVGITPDPKAYIGAKYLFDKMVNYQEANKLYETLR